jgi:hypothetical protein
VTDIQCEVILTHVGSKSISKCLCEALQHSTLLCTGKKTQKVLPECRKEPIQTGQFKTGQNIQADTGECNVT